MENGPIIITLALCGTLAFMAHAPCMAALHESTRMPALVWHGSAAWWKRPYGDGGDTITDWMCLVPHSASADNDLENLRQSFAPPANATLSRETVSIYGSTPFLMVLASFVVLYAWMLLIATLPAVTSWVRVRRQEGETNSWANTCMLSIGVMISVGLYVGAQWCLWYLHETFIALINFTQMTQDPGDNSCITYSDSWSRPRDYWQWPGLPNFTDGANAACRAVGCLMPPYVNASWWWMGLGVLAAPLVVVGWMGVVYVFEGNEGHRRDHRKVAWRALLSIPVFAPVVLIVLGIMLVWRTATVMHPLFDLTWSRQIFQQSAPMYQAQKITSLVIVSLWTIIVAFYTAHRHCASRALSNIESKEELSSTAETV